MNSPDGSEQGSLDQSASEIEGMIFQLADASVQGCNQAAESILGLTREQLQAWTSIHFLKGVVNPDGTPLRPEAHPAIAALHTGQPSSPQLLGFYRANQPSVWIRLQAQPLFRAKESVPYAVVSTFVAVQPPLSPALRDEAESSGLLETHPTAQSHGSVAAQASGEEAAHQVPIDIETIYATAPIGLCFIDTDLKFVCINEHLAAINGLPVSAHLGRTLRDILTDQADILDSLYRQVIETGEPILNLEVHGTNQAQPGVERDWAASLYPLKREDGQVLGVNVMVQEVTERKCMERALHEANQQLVNTFERMTDAYVAVDRDWRITYVNQITAQINQVSPEELIGRCHWEVWAAAIGTICEENYRRAIAEQTPVHFEFFYETRQRWYEIHAYPSPQGLGIFFRDIDDRKRAEATLQAREEQLRLALEFSQIGSWDWNLRTNQVQWDENHFRIMGLEPGSPEVSYRTWRDRIHPEDIDAVEAVIQQALQHYTTYEAEYRVMYPNGSLHWLSGKGRAIYDESGQPIRMLGVLLDITERKRVEADLQIYKDLFQFAEHGLAINIGPQMLIVNPAFARMHGYTVEEMTGKLVLELFPPEYQDEKLALTQQFKTLDHLTHETVHVRKDGHIFPILLDITVVRNEQGQMSYQIVTALDITERKDLEQDRQEVEMEVYKLNQRLHYLVQVIQQLAAARDLKTIMAVVHTMVRQVIMADGSTVILRDGAFCYYASEDAIAPLWQGQRFSLDDCISGWVMLNRQAAVIADINADARIVPDFYRSTFVKSLVMIPLRSSEPLGAIGIYWATSYTPTPEELILLQSLADAVAIALENLHLYETLEQHVQERTAQLQQALEFEALLKRITDKVRDSLDEQQILQTAVNELSQGLVLECCDTGLYNADQTISTIAYEFTQTLTPIRNTQFEIASSSHVEVYQALFQGQLCQFCSLCATPVRPEQQSLTILACPIWDDQGILGDLWLFKASQSIFTEPEVRLVQQVANQCAIALRQSRLYQASQSQIAALEQLNQLKDDFLSTVSHELRSPMANIKMATQMLELTLGISRQGGGSALPAERSLQQFQTTKALQYFQILNQECQRETGLINDLLDLARLDAGKASLNVDEILLQQWIPQVVHPFHGRIQQQRQQLQIQLAADLPPLTTDIPSLERVVTELIQNACKYTPPEGRIILTAQVQATTIQVVVSNSGVEIPLTEQDRIFDKFYRIPNNDPWKHGGTGLGLTLVKKLVEILQGTIHISSGNGWTTFTLSLPSHL